MGSYRLSSRRTRTVRTSGSPIDTGRGTESLSQMINTAREWIPVYRKTSLAYSIVLDWARVTLGGSLRHRSTSSWKTMIWTSVTRMGRRGRRHSVRDACHALSGLVAYCLLSRWCLCWQWWSKSWYPTMGKVCCLTTRLSITTARSHLFSPLLHLHNRISRPIRLWKRWWPFELAPAQSTMKTYKPQLNFYFFNT